ncbi:winged helix-turn-helix domain-containing protein [Virgibacillus sp. FSP13]
MAQFTMEALEDLESDWLEREDLEVDDERNAWLEEGIDLYEQFISLNKREPRFSVTLASLYLELGRDEKIRRGNYQRAYNILRRATIHAPNNPDAYYHLSFILAGQDRKWEAVIFYGKEALEKGLDNSKKIKLLCCLALGYIRLGYLQKANKLIDDAYNLDKDLEHEWFIELYTDRMRKKHSEPILLKEPEKKRKNISRQDSEKLKEDAMEGNSFVLDLTQDIKYFNAKNDAVRLENKEAEVLGFLIDNQMTSCSRQKIEEAVWHDKDISSTSVKRYISSLRRKLVQAIGCENIAETVLVTIDGKYQWKADTESIVLRRG